MVHFTDAFSSAIVDYGIPDPTVGGEGGDVTKDNAPNSGEGKDKK